MPSTKKRVLFVCMGNICRSPAAEAVLTKIVNEKNLAHAIDVDSAGTHDYHVGEAPDHRMKTAGEHRGYQFVTFARQFVSSDLDNFDLIVAMDRANLKRIQQLGDASRAEIKLLGEFLSDDDDAEVPDPYYGGAQGFEQVLDMLEAACPAIIDHLQSHR